MMENDAKKVLSWTQFVESGFDGSDYTFPNFEGKCDATVVCKRWDKHQNLIAFLACDDGTKLMTSAWQDTDYYGLKDIPVGAKIRCTFKSSENGKCYLRGVELL